MSAIVIVIIVIAFIGLFAYGIVSKHKREQAMLALATKNGWTALSNDAVTLNSLLPQYIQQLGQQGVGFGNYLRSHTSYDMAYRATLGSHTATMFQYEYTEYHRPVDQQQTEESTTHNFTVLNVAMPVAEPTVMLLHHNFISKLANFGLHGGLQKIDLEGDFSQYYDTYIAPNGQVEALSIFTPDVMEIVVNMAGQRTHASLQLGGRTLAISFEDQLLTPEFIEPLLGQVASLLAKLDAKPNARLQASTSQ